MNPQQVAELIRAGCPAAARRSRARTTCISRRWWSPRHSPAARRAAAPAGVRDAREPDGQRDPRARACRYSRRKSMRRSASDAVDKLQIHGGIPLEGEIRISGAKNATLPILAGCLLADGPVTVSNVPHLQDVTTMIELLGRMGVDGDHRREDAHRGRRVDDQGILRALPAGEDHARLDPGARARCSRASARADVSLPGGCAIGARPVNIHVAGLQAMGADIHIENGYIKARAERLKGARLVLETVTVTGTENLMMAAALADGRDGARERGARAGSGGSREFPHRHGREDQGRGHRQDRHRGRRAAAAAPPTRCCPIASRAAPTWSRAPSPAATCA